MKSSAKLFGFGPIFFIPAAIVYGFLTDFDEWVGFLGLLLLAAMTLMVGFYLAQTDKHTGRMPEDDPRGDVHEGAGEVGVFAPWSWWPLVLSSGAALGFLALAMGHWIFIGCAILVVIGLFGWVYEFSMGRHAH